MMKKYLALGALTLVLGACTGGDKDMVADSKADVTPEVLMQQAEQAYQSGDKAAAVAAWETAAAAGNPIAQHHLSVVYREGDGVTQDEQKALNWLTQSAEQGYAPALTDVAVLYMRQGNVEQALPLLQSAVEQGYPPAQFNLGVMLVRGDGVQKNEELGMALIQQAAGQGYAPAQKALQGN